MASAQYIIDLVRPLLNDSVGPYRYADVEVLRWISDAQREIVRYKPEAYIVTDVYAVNPQNPRQELHPDDAFALIRVEANGTAGAPGAAGAVWLATHKPAARSNVTTTATFTITIPAGVNRVLVGEFVVGNLTDFTSLNHTITVAGLPAPLWLSREDTGVSQGVATSIFSAPLGTSTEAQSIDVVITFTATGLTNQSVMFQGNTFENVVQADAAAWVSDDTAAYAGAAFLPISTPVVNVGDLVFSAAAGYDVSTPAYNTAPAAGFTPNLTTNGVGATLASAYAVGVSGVQTLTWTTSNAQNVTFGHANLIVLGREPVPADSPVWGDMVRRVDRHVIDSLHSAWPYTIASPVPAQGSFFKEWSLDPHAPRGFYLNPAPDPDTLQLNDVVVTFVGNPPEITITTDSLVLSDMYNYSVINYIMYRALSNQAQGFSAAGSTAALRRFGAELQLDRVALQALLGTPSRAEGATK